MKYLRTLIYKEKKVILGLHFSEVPVQDWWAHYCGLLVGVPYDNGGEQMAEQTVHFMAVCHERKTVF
jgi:hypothetical protein